jgi:hypothetical protein
MENNEDRPTIDLSRQIHSITAYVDKRDDIPQALDRLEIENGSYHGGSWQLKGHTYSSPNRMIWVFTPYAEQTNQGNEF